MRVWYSTKRLRGRGSRCIAKAMGGLSKTWMITYQYMHRLIRKRPCSIDSLRSAKAARHDWPPTSASLRPIDKEASVYLVARVENRGSRTAALTPHQQPTHPTFPTHPSTNSDNRASYLQHSPHREQDLQPPILASLPHHHPATKPALSGNLRSQSSYLRTQPTNTWPADPRQ